MNQHNRNPHISQPQDRFSTLQYIVQKVETGLGLPLSELKKQYTEERLFQLGLKYITTTKKAFCEALDIPVEAGCRYKRTLEQDGLLVQSADEVICPFTKHPAHLLSTNEKEFAWLLKSNSSQLNLFD